QPAGERAGACYNHPEIAPQSPDHIDQQLEVLLRRQPPDVEQQFRSPVASGFGDQISPALFGTARRGEIVNIHAHRTNVYGSLVPGPHRAGKFGGGVVRIGDVIIEERNVAVAHVKPRPEPAGATPSEKGFDVVVHPLATHADERRTLKSRNPPAPE